MPQVHYSNGNDDDLIVSKRIHEKLPKKLCSSVHLIDEDLNPSELKYIIGQMDYFIGTRMHSNIFALAMGVKTIAIAYEPKTIGIMNDLELSKYVIRMEEITSDNIFFLFNEIRDDDNYLPLLSSNLERIKRHAISDLPSFIN